MEFVLEMDGETPPTGQTLHCWQFTPESTVWEDVESGTVFFEGAKYRLTIGCGKFEGPVDIELQRKLGAELERIGRAFQQHASANSGPQLVPPA